MPYSTTITGVSTVLNTFFGVPTDASDANYVFLGVPFDGTTTYRHGAKNGPTAIRAASQHIESFCLAEGATLDAAQLPLADIGDVVLTSNSVQTMLQSVESVVSSISQTLILIGGEHTITLGSVRALPRDIVVIQFDAHMDLRDQYNRNPFMHACVMRRVVEHLGPDHLVQVGIRAVSQEEYEYAQTNHIPYYTVNDIQEQGTATIAHKINNALPPGPPVYLSVDMDVLDPAFAPAVGNPEAGGLTTLQLLSLIRLLASRAIALDITEVAPQYDQGITAICAARLITTFLCANAQQRSMQQRKF